jgi:hypothetical protein
MTFSIYHAPESYLFQTEARKTTYDALGVTRLSSQLLSHHLGHRFDSPFHNMQLFTNYTYIRGHEHDLWHNNKAALHTNPGIVAVK